MGAERRGAGTSGSMHVRCGPSKFSSPVGRGLIHLNRIDSSIFIIE